MTKLEALLRHFMEDEMAELFQSVVPRGILERPATVPVDVYLAALAGDAKAVRDVNRMKPGSIFNYEGIRSHIHRHIVRAALSPEPDIAFASREWLKVAILPFVSYSHRGDAKETPRSELGVPHLKVFRHAYQDIVLVRAVAKPRRTGAPLAASRLRAVFPELGALSGKTAMGTERRHWGNLIAGYKVTDDDLEILDPRKSAMQILADITGFGMRHVYKRLLEINGGDLKPALDELRADAIRKASAFGA